MLLDLARDIGAGTVHWPSLFLAAYGSGGITWILAMLTGDEK